MFLQNDSFKSGDEVSFQGGFYVGECWASVYEPEPEHYPFRLANMRMIYGGVPATETFRVSVWSVEDDLTPAGKLTEGELMLTGNSNDWTIVDMDDLDPPLDDFVDGNFAVTVCLFSHDGLPGIAADTDARMVPLHNWIYSQGWWTAEALNVSGDWIMRAGIEPLG